MDLLHGLRARARAASVVDWLAAGDAGAIRRTATDLFGLWQAQYQCQVGTLSGRYSGDEGKARRLILIGLGHIERFVLNVNAAVAVLPPRNRLANRRVTAWMANNRCQFQ